MTDTQLLAERATGIGGSDAASLLNVGYGCRRRLWMEKRGIEPDYPLESPILRRGKQLEALVAEEYAAQTGRKVHRSLPVDRHPVHEFLLVHRDGIIVDDGHPEIGTLEIKTMGQYAFARAKREGLPIDYVLQMNWALMVTQTSWGSFAIFHPDSWTLKWFDVERDEALRKSLFEEGIAFWGLVENGPAPERLDPADKRCASCQYRTECQGEALLTAAKAEAVDGEVPYDVELASLVREYRQAHEVAEEANDLLDSVKVRLKTALGDRQVVDTAGARLYFRAVQVKEYKVKASVRRTLKVYSK